MKNIKIKCILCTNINTKFNIIVKDNKDNILLNTKTNIFGWFSYIRINCKKNRYG